MRKPSKDENCKTGKRARWKPCLQVERVEVVVALLAVHGSIPVQPRQRARQDGDLHMHCVCCQAVHSPAEQFLSSPAQVRAKLQALATNKAAFCLLV